jgi:hypothetical protein
MRARHRHPLSTECALVVIESVHLLACLWDLSVTNNIRPSKIGDAPLLSCSLYQRPPKEYDGTRWNRGAHLA